MRPALARPKPQIAFSAAVQRGSAAARRIAAPLVARPAFSSRMPPHPGRFLETRFLTPLGITQSDLALALGVSRRRVNELIRGHRGITPDTAVRLALYFGNDAAFWLQLQLAWDVYAAQRKLAESRLPKK